MAARAERLPLFDALRCLAIVGVVFIHTTYQPAVAARVGESWWRFAVHLDVAVPIFFAVSGFLLYRPFVAARAEGRRVSVKAYAWRRLFRVVPPFWVALTIITLWLGLEEVKDEPLRYYGFAQIYSGATALQGMPQAWTLCVEVTFYLLLPAWALGMWALARRMGGGLLRAEVVGLGALVVFAVLWNGVALTHSDPASLESLDLLLPLPANIDHLALGMLLAVLSVWIVEGRKHSDRRAQRVGELLDRVPGGAWWLGALGVWLLTCFVAGPDGSPGDPIDDRGYLLRHVLNGGVAVLLLMPAVFGDMSRGAVRRGMALRPVLYIGTISYSIYLWHYAVLSQMYDWWGGLPASTLGWALWTLVMLAAVILVATVSYYAVERPAMLLGRRLASRQGSDDQPGAASVPVAPPPAEKAASDAAAAPSG